MNENGGSGKIDLTRRDRKPEIMDTLDLPSTRLIDTLKGLQRVNTMTRSTGLMWPDLKATARRHLDRPIRVLDVACGGGDVLIALWRYSNKAGIKAEFEGCDLNQKAVDYARGVAVKAGAPIKFFRHDVTRDPIPDGYDMIMSTLFLHHLDEGDAISFLHEAGIRTRDRVVIQDLVRSKLSYWFARVGTSVLMLNDICRFDGRTSVEGAFTLSEAGELAWKAGLNYAQVIPRLPFRYLIRWIKS
jgi:SAM-dependent methyltransferase